MVVQRRVITTAARRVLRKNPQTSTNSSAIPLVLVIWLAAVAAFFFSASWVVPCVVTKLHDDFLKDYLNSLKWDEAALWQSNTSKVPWQYDWFACADDKDDGPIDVFHPLHESAPGTPAEALDSVLYHGMTVLPKVLPTVLAKNFKNFVLNRAEQVSLLESIPVLTHNNRKSFGLDLREDPSIAAAMHALASNPLLTKTLESLLGANPAIVELSTITAQPGAKAQPWHADSNPNTMTYERHFTQVFTVLIPLQDTTHDMGATWVCPGTHRCQPPPVYCNTHGYSIATTNGTTSNYWRAGDALLYSSDTHHRGGAHVDWNGPPRTVLILSLTSRPENQIAPSGRPSRWRMPSRTLPLGPVFGIRWDHWGLTWKQFQNKELLDEFIQASENDLTNILRAMGLFALEHDDGWTFAQSLSYGMMNDMMGYRLMDLEAFHKSEIIPFLSGLPWFLQGRIQPTDSDYAPWPRYLSDITRNFRDTVTILNGVLAIALLFMAVNGRTEEKATQASSQQKHRPRKVAVGAFLVVYLSVVIIGTIIWIRTSSELSATIRARPTIPEEVDNNPPPFPPQDLLMSNDTASPDALHDYLDKTVAADFQNVMLVDRGTSTTNTSLSQRWLKYYPGNRRWLSTVRDHSISWLNYHGLPEVFVQAVLDRIILSSGSDEHPTFVRRTSFGGWEALSRSGIEAVTEQALLEWWTTPILEQRWGPPILQASGPCSPPRVPPPVICSSNSAQLLLKRSILPYITSQRMKNLSHFFGESIANVPRRPSSERVPIARDTHQLLSNELLTINDRVEARWKGGHHWVNGKVALLYKMEASVYYDVQYDMWGYEKMVPQNFVRRRRRRMDLAVQKERWYRVQTASSRYTDVSTILGRQPACGESLVRLATEVEG